MGHHPLWGKICYELRWGRVGKSGHPHTQTEDGGEQSCRAQQHIFLSRKVYCDGVWVAYCSFMTIEGLRTRTVEAPFHYAVWCTYFHVSITMESKSTGWNGSHFGNPSTQIGTLRGQEQNRPHNTTGLENAQLRHLTCFLKWKMSARRNKRARRRKKKKCSTSAVVLIRSLFGPACFVGQVST